jgi:uncharacterized membrane protein
MHIFSCGFAAICHAHFAAAAFAVFGISPMIFWAYVAACVVLLVGLARIIKTGLAGEHGIDKILLFGPLIFAIPFAVFGTEHLTDTADMTTMVPQWLPAHTFWIYLVGIALIAAALSIASNIQSRLAATLLGLTLCSFVLLIHIPNIISQPGDRILVAVGLRDLAFAGGAFAFAGSRRSAGYPGRADGLPWLATIGRFFIAVPVLFFSVEHFLHPTFLPGVPLNKLTPRWIPGSLFWAYLTGVVLIISGLCLIANWNARRAATYLGVTIMLLMLFVYLPLLISSPADIVAINYFFDTLTFGGAALVLAEAIKERIVSPRT